MFIRRRRPNWTSASARRYCRAFLRWVWSEWWNVLDLRWDYGYCKTCRVTWRNCLRV